MAYTLLTIAVLALIAVCILLALELHEQKLLVQHYCELVLLLQKEKKNGNSKKQRHD